MRIGTLERIMKRAKVAGGGTVEVQRKTTTAYDPISGNITSWDKLFDIEAAIQELGGNEFIKVDKLNIEATHIMYVQEKPDIQVEDRILYNSKYYYITYVDDPMNLNDFLQIYLTTGDNYGVSSD